MVVLKPILLRGKGWKIQVDPNAELDVKVIRKVSHAEICHSVLCADFANVCLYMCKYCYGAKYWVTGKIYGKTPDAVRRFAKRHADLKYPIRFGSLSDIFDHRVNWTVFELAEKAVRHLNEYDYPYIICTKSDLTVHEGLTRVVEESKRENFELQVTITTTDEKVARFWEPGAPSPRERLRCLKHFADAGYDVVIRVGPIYPDAFDRWDFSLIDFDVKQFILEVFWAYGDWLWNFLVPRGVCPVPEELIYKEEEAERYLASQILPREGISPESIKRVPLVYDPEDGRYRWGGPEDRRVIYEHYLEKIREHFGNTQRVAVCLDPIKRRYPHLLPPDGDCCGGIFARFKERWRISSRWRKPVNDMLRAVIGRSPLWWRPKVR